MLAPYQEYRLSALALAFISVATALKRIGSFHSHDFLGEANTKLHTEPASEIFVPLQLKLILKVGTTRFHKDRLTSMVGKYSDHIFQTKQKMKKIYPYPYKYWILPENIFLVF